MAAAKTISDISSIILLLTNFKISKINLNDFNVKLDNFGRTNKTFLPVKKKTKIKMGSREAN